ncbi:MAG: hypothetical protein AB1351_05290 [Thermoproteota archaeon]
MEISYKTRKNDLNDLRGHKYEILQQLARDGGQERSLPTYTKIDAFTTKLLLLTMRCEGLIKKTECGYILTNKGREKIMSGMADSVENRESRRNATIGNR